ncbi:MAG: hypothetical protein JWM89_1867 [Acidimicrobiales bacterium]|nr:hypothetical protein [Acidimicrobiales bacterium]
MRQRDGVEPGRRPADVVLAIVAAGAAAAVVLGLSAHRRVGRAPTGLVLLAVSLGALTALATRRLNRTGRADEPPALLLAAMAVLFVALPDTELILIGAATLAVAAGAGIVIGPGPPDRRWAEPSSLGMVTAYVVLVEAAGRPTAGWVAVAALAPLLVSARSAQSGRAALARRVAAGLVVGVTTARLTALGRSGTRSVLGAIAAVALVALVELAVARRSSKAAAQPQG